MKTSPSLGAALLASVGVMCSPFKEDPADGGVPDVGVEPDVPAPMTGPRGNSADAESDSGSGSPCDLRKPFGSPVFVAGLMIPEAQWVGGLRLSPDNLTGYFFANGSPEGPDPDPYLYSATRTTSDDAFGGIALIDGTGVNTAGDYQYDPTVSGDGLQLIFTRYPQGSLYSATRTVPSGPFTYQGPLMADSTKALESPFLRQDGQELYFTSGDAGESTYNGDIYRALRDGSAFGPGAPVAGLNTECNDSNPVITPDDLTIYWHSNRPDCNVSDLGDIWTAQRTSMDDPFGPARNVTEVNSPERDIPTFVTSDGCTLYLSRYMRDNDHPNGVYTQYVAQKQR
jgi:hypothetical protein